MSTTTVLRRLLAVGVPALLAALALAGAVASTGTLPHTHLGQGPGLYNLDHDLAYLATLGAAVLAMAGLAVPVALVGEAAPAAPPAVPITAARRHTDPRAPPLR